MRVLAVFTDQGVIILALIDSLACCATELPLAQLRVASSAPIN
jgi:hypothetical protein